MTDRNTMLIEMFQRSMNMREISNATGVSRNVVAGVIYRARMRGEKIEILFKKDGTPLGEKPKPAPKPPISKVNVSGQIKRKLNGPIPTRPVLPTTTTDIERMVFDRMPEGVKGLTLMLLKSTNCHYLLPEKHDGQYLYCGEEVHAKSYCKHHFKLCYVSIATVKAGYKIKKYSRN